MATILSFSLIPAGRETRLTQHRIRRPWKAALTISFMLFLLLNQRTSCLVHFTFHSLWGFFPTFTCPLPTLMEIIKIRIRIFYCASGGTFFTASGGTCFARGCGWFQSTFDGRLNGWLLCWPLCRSTINWALNRDLPLVCHVWENDDKWECAYKVWYSRYYQTTTRLYHSPYGPAMPHKRAGCNVYNNGSQSNVSLKTRVTV